MVTNDFRLISGRLS